MRLQSHSTAGRMAAVFLTASAILIGLAGSARAQQVQGGPTIPIVAAYIRGVDTAAAPNGTYLVVGGQGPVYAVCVNAQGTAISGAMLINATPGGYASFPRAVYSPDVNGGLGGFMVVWAEAVGNPDAMRQLFARVVACSGAMSAPQVVWPQVWWEPGNLALAVLEHEQGFSRRLADARAHGQGGADQSRRRCDFGARPAFSRRMGRDPSVTWNPTTNEFGVAFSGETYSAFAAVPAWNAAAFRRNTFNVGGGKLTAMTDIVYNPASGRYVMAWYEISSGNFAKVAEFDASGALRTTGIASARLGSYDAFSMALNQVSLYVPDGRTRSSLGRGAGPGAELSRIPVQR